MADILENQEIDKDTVEPEVLERLFHKPFNLITETSVSVKKSYINRINGNKSLKVAVSLSDNSVEVYELNGTSLNKVCRFSGHEKPVTDVVFSPKDDNLVYSSGLDGVVKLWDTRCSGSCVQEYKDEEDKRQRPYACMDVCRSGRVMCAGAELLQGDAYLLFWDQRRREPLGGYWNSHTDDITQVRFHPEKPSILATGSLDGLLNVFNIAESTEDDALTYSLNVENSVERVRWLDECHAACVTQSNDLQLWDCDTGDLRATYQRDKLAKTIKRSRGDDCYLVDAYTTLDGQQVILAGSNGGDGSCLRSVTLKDKKLQPRTNFVGSTQIVTCCWHNREKEILVTAGEAGLMQVWSASEAGATTSLTTKQTTKINKLNVNRHKPY